MYYTDLIIRPAEQAVRHLLKWASLIMSFHLALLFYRVVVILRCFVVKLQPKRAKKLIRFSLPTVAWQLYVLTLMHLHCRILCIVLKIRMRGLVTDS